MKNDLVKRIIPHIVAILIFLIVSIAFCRPALEGNVLNQHDIVGWKGMAQNAFDYKEKTGHFPLWNTNVFSGMPNYLIAMEGKSILPDLTKILSLGLPQPASFFFLAALCFYILCMALRARPIVGIFGALAFAFATYNPIIIAAGHVTKMYAIAYMPLLLAGLILIYEKKYWLGLAIATLGTYQQIAANHPQISFYLILVAGAITIGYLVSWIKRKDWKHTGIALGIAAAAGIAGLMANSLSFLVTSEYSKATIRGGKTLEILGDSVTSKKSAGLDTSYAFEYSLGKAEVLTTIMPNAFGGSRTRMLDENSSVTEKLTQRGVQEGPAMQVSSGLTSFWGDPASTGGGPLYAGAIVCILALIGFVLYKGPIRWALLAISVLAIFMAWGKHFAGFNLFLFENLPFYNKFRAPSITMVIVQLTIPIAAVLGMQLLFFRDRSQELLKADFRKILYATGALFALLLIFYLGLDYSAVFDREIIAGYTQGGSDEFGRLIVAGLKEERKALFGAQLLRTFGFIVFVLALLWMYMKNILNRTLVIVGLTLVTLVDQWLVDKDYLKEDDYQSRDELTAQTATKTAVDNQILADTSPQFRVYNAGQERFSAGDYHVSTFHRSIGGYHPAKLRIYQDVIQRYLMGGANPQQILNMLNTKYIILQNPQTGQESLLTNDQAYGPCWFVSTVKIVNDDVQEIQSLGATNLRDTALVQQAYASHVTQPQRDSVSTIALTSYDNDAIEYTADCKGPQFAVFSEIFYPYGWNAYLDGRKVEYVRTNYILRGLSIPPGKHNIKFVFEPATYKKGLNIAFIGSFIIALFVLGGFFMAWRESRKKQHTAIRND